MISRRCLAVLLFVFAIAPLPAVAFVDPPTIVPEHPDARDELVLMARMGGCHDVTDGPVRLEREGSRVNVHVQGVALEPGHPFCVFDPPGTARIPIGRLPPGTYSVHLWIYDELYRQDFDVGSADLTVASIFRITASESLALALLAIALVVFGWRNRVLPLVALALLASPRASLAQETLHILLSAAPGAPSPSDIVEGYDFAAGVDPPLSGLAAGQPTGSAYLLPRRARARFAQWLAAHPQSARARLERYLVVTYPSAAQRAQGAAALKQDPDVEAVYAPLPVVGDEPGQSIGRLGPQPQATPYWADAAGRHLARKFGAGWTLVGVPDSGIATEHPAFVAFAAGRYRGGGYLPTLSADVGRTGIAGCQTAGNCIDFDVDEVRPAAIPAGGICDPDGDGMGLPARAGHGTHVAGLIAAHPDNTAYSGACPDCSLAVWRVAADSCSNTLVIVRPAIRAAAVDAAITHLADLGAQVINLSFTRNLTDPAYCTDNFDDSACLALQHAAERGVLLVGAAGNQRAAIAFPASDARVLAVGGLGNDGALWSRDPDPAPDHLDGCPRPPAVATVGQECGSNFTTAPNLRQQELVAPAEDVYSTMYPGLAWNVGLGCGDASDGEDGDGWGPCTGTSMAAPIVSGVAGLLRSFNPLLDPDEIRAGLAQSTPEARSGKAWSSTLGHGRVDAGAAAQRVLGAVRGGIVRNRATPVFGLHSSDADDHAAVATPQMALALLHADAAWTARGSTIAGYQAWPDGQIVDAPRAIAWVLTTDRRTRSDQPQLQPLFLLQRVRVWPAGCVAGTDGCNALHRDLLLASGVADLEARIADGYELLGRQGFVFARCTPEPQCIPPYAQPLRRQCHPGRDDCAVFLEAERAVFEAQGYVANAAILGHAYANVDTDHDTLVDGFESLLGTDFSLADSDGDATADGIEYPAAGLSATDPCAGPQPQCGVPRIFLDDFE